MALRAMSALHIRSKIHNLYTKEIDFSLVTIVQPILSGDPLLKEKLETNVKNIPNANFLWLIDKNDLCAQEASRQIISSNPYCKVSIVLCGVPPSSCNPKIFKLALSEQIITTPFLLVLDDDTTIPESTLANLLSALSASDLATSLPFCLNDGKWCSKLLASFVNNNSVFTYISPLCLMKPITINGMCYAMKTEYLKKIGGFSVLSNQLTDDLALATLVAKSNGVIHQSTSPHFVQTSVSNIKSYFRLMHRWFLFATLLVRQQSVKTSIIVIIFCVIPPVMLSAIFFISIKYKFISGILFLVFLRSLIVISIQKEFSYNVFHSVIFSILSEIFQPIHLIHAVISRKIVWRNKKYLVINNDNFVRIDDNSNEK